MAMSSKSMTMGSQANTDTVCVSVTDFHPWLLVLRECATAAHTRPSTCHTRWETNHACAHPQRSENLCDTPQASGRADQRIKKKKKKKKKRTENEMNACAASIPLLVPFDRSLPIFFFALLR
jgi:hypothetical protein